MEVIDIIFLVLTSLSALLSALPVAPAINPIIYLVMLRRTIQSSIFSSSHLHRCVSSKGLPGSSPLLPSSTAVFQISQNRYFFFGGSGNDDDDNNKKGDKDKKDEKPKEKEDDNNAADETEDNKQPSATLDNSSKYNKSSPRYGGSPNVMLPASRLGFGDQAPRYPHLMALPVIRGPVFPGVLTPITVTDKVSFL